MISFSFEKYKWYHQKIVFSLSWSKVYSVQMFSFLLDTTATETATQYGYSLVHQILCLCNCFLSLLK